MNIKGKGQRLIPEELLKYLEALKNKYPDAVDLVEANPTLEGGEDSLSSVLINGTKYAVGGGGAQLYEHNIDLNFSGSLGNVSLRIETSISEPFTISTLYQWFIDNEIIYDASLLEYNFFPVEMYQMGNWKYYINGLSAVTNQTNKFFVNALYFKSDSNDLAMLVNAYEPASITDVVKLK